MKEIILAYQGEMSLKGLNRATFESVLLKTCLLYTSDAADEL